MTNQEKKVPELRFPEFDGEWEEKTIGKIATTFSGGTPSSTNRSYYNGEIPFIRSGEISKSSTELMINKEAISNSSAKMVEKGDLLYALYGATSGEVAISKISGAINQAVLCIRSQESATYIFNYLKMKKDQILKTYIQGGQGNLSASIIKKVDINLPYIEEQQKIGGFFSKLDQQIELEEQKLTLLEKQKKGYMQQIFSQKLRFKDENGSDYPEWKKEIIGNIATTFSGGTPSSTNSTFYTGEIPFIRSGEISKTSTELMINEKAISNSSAKMVETGDLLYALYGATSGEVAISKINGAINQAVLCIHSQESIAYIFNYLKMKKDQILKTYIQGGQGNLSASIIKKVDIDLPNLEEQKLIGHFFNKFDDYIEIQSDKVELLKERKKGFLQKMFV